jgi:hypothetical protein
MTTGEIRTLYIVREIRRTGAESGTRAAVGDRRNPGQLGLVDGEVGTRGTQETLLV